jgi:hypothetical protein
MTSREPVSRLNRRIAELKMIPLLQRRLDDDTINSQRQLSEPRLGPQSTAAAPDRTLSFRLNDRT